MFKLLPKTEKLKFPQPPNVGMLFSFVTLFFYFLATFLVARFIPMDLSFQFIFPQLFFLIAIVGYSIKTKQRPKQLGIRLNQRIFLWGLLWATIPLLGVFILSQLTQWSKGEVTSSLLLSHHIPLMTWDIQYLLLAGLVAPIIEETFFRGIMMTAIGKHLGMPRAIVITSVFFMAAHLHLHVGALVLGIIVGSIYYIHKSIIPAIFFHMSCNIIGFVIMRDCPDLFRFIRLLYG